MVVGGGLVGCETAINLKNQGKLVSIVEMRPGLAIDVNEFARMALEQQLSGIAAYTGAKASAITEDGVACVDESGKELFLPADSVVCAAGLRPRWKQALELVNLTPEYFLVGDCKTPRQITQAMSEAYYAMREI